MKVALYARVSTDDKHQNPETQLFALRNFCTDAKWQIFEEYVDKASAKDYQKRVSWSQLLKDARQRKFQCVLVFKLDRAWRSVRECLNTLHEWQEMGIKFKSLKDDYIDTTTAAGKVMLVIGAAFAELESSLISERVSAGMARAKARGSRIGRKSYSVSFTNVCKACQIAGSSDGKPLYTKAAKILSETIGRKVSPGFIHIRITREALERNIERDILIKRIVKKKIHIN